MILQRGSGRDNIQCDLFILQRGDGQKGKTHYITNVLTKGLLKR